MSAPLAALREVFGALLPDRTLEDAEPLGRGHIHHTFRARCRDASGARAHYVAQQINRAVFRDAQALERNLARVTDHLWRALRARGVADPERRALRPVRSPAGRSLQETASGDAWRVFQFVERSHAIDTPDSPAQAERAARAFGGFVADLADLDPACLDETIPRFHDLAGRRDALVAAAGRDAAARAREVARELDAALRASERVLRALAQAPTALPQRIVHNDCKLNNLLFDDDSGEPLCVVDLDTVMPGTVLFDFGELARTGACRAAEDERDLARVTLDAALFRALATGFVAGARGLLTSDEIRALALAGPLMALENGVRFLTDHLDGDVYFRIARPGHNLDRARAQLRLADEMLRAERELRAVFDALEGHP